MLLSFARVNMNTYHHIHTTFLYVAILAHYAMLKSSRQHSRWVDRTIVKYARPGSCRNGRTEKRDILKCRHGFKAFTREGCEDVARGTHPERSATQSYSSDGTPALMNRRWTARVQGREYVRRGKKNNDMLVERCFSRDGIPQESQLLVMVSDPMPLTEGNRLGITSSAAS